MTARRIHLALAALVAAVLAALAAAQPTHGADWARLAVDAPRAEGVAALLGGACAAWPALHALVAAGAALTLVYALAGHALGRWPRLGEPRDGRALVLTFALLWLTVPNLGATLLAHASVGGVVGLAALALLLLAARTGGGPAPAALLLGALAGATTGPAALVAVGCLAAGWRARPARRTWIFFGVAGLVAGLALAVLGPWAAPAGARLRGILLLLELDRFARKLGEAAALAVLVAFAQRARGARVELPEGLARRVLWLAGLAVILEALTVALPHRDAALLPVLSPGVVAAVALLDALAEPDARVRALVTGLAAAVGTIALALGAVVTARVHRDFAAREATLAAAPAGAQATVRAYRDEAGTFFAGEDLVDVATRARVAARHRLTEILLDERVAGFQPAPPHELHAGSIALVRYLPEARRQRARLAPAAPIVVDGLDWPERRGRPVVAADEWVPAATLHPPDRYGHADFVVSAPALAADAEIVVVHDGAVVPSERHGARVTFAPTAFGAHDLVVCDPTRCLLVDSMVVRP